MPRRLTDVPEHLREPHEIEMRGFWRVYFVAIGVAILLGLLTGSVWIAWRLLSERLGQ